MNTKLLGPIWVGILLAGCSLLWCSPLRAATNLVLSGDDLQSRLEAASAGDTLVIQGGTYPGIISIRKPLTLVRSGSDPVQVVNGVTIDTPGVVHLSQIQMLDQVTATTTNLDLRLYDCVVGRSLNAANGRLILKRSRVGETLNVTNADLDALRLTNFGRVNLVGGATNRLFRAVFSQCEVRALINARSYRVTTAHTFVQGLNFLDVESTHVGLKAFNSVDRVTALGHAGAVYLGRGKHRFTNGEMFFSAIWELRPENVSTVLIEHADVTILNCNLICWGGYFQTYQDWVRNSYGILTYGGKVISRNNYFQLHSYGATRVGVMAMNGAVVDFSDSMIYGAYWDPGRGDSLITDDIRAVPVGGDTPVNPVDVRVLTAPTVKISWTNQWGFTTAMLTNSVLGNAGSKDPLMNNPDGTRNTIGATGGPLYNPANATTDRPITFWLDTQPRRVVKGVDRTVRVEVSAAAGH